MTETPANYSADARPVYFHVYCLDAPGAAAIRAANASAHRDYIQAHKHLIYVGGPLMADEDETRVGSYMMLKMASREEVQAFLANEPYSKAGVFETISIRKAYCAVHP